MFRAIFSKNRLEPSSNAKCQKIEMASCKNHCDTKFVQLHQLRFSLSHILLSLEMETILTGLFLLNLKFF